jgi:hypothetical protein
MKLIDFTKNAGQESPLQNSLSQIREKLPFLGKTSTQIQEMILAHFQRGLDNRFTMIQNFAPEWSVEADLILVGPTGVAVLNRTWTKVSIGSRKKPGRS